MLDCGSKDPFVCQLKTNLACKNNIHFFRWFLCFYFDIAKSARGVTLKKIKDVSPDTSLSRLRQMNCRTESPSTSTSAVPQLRVDVLANKVYYVISCSSFKQYSFMHASVILHNYHTYLIIMCGAIIAYSYKFIVLLFPVLQ